MVKVFPNNFNFIEKQQLLTSVPREPIAIVCSNKCLFVAEEDCVVEVFSLETLAPLGQFRTVSPVVDIVYNSKGDCIITLERKNPSSHGYSRVYFKWRGASIDKPMRISLLTSLAQSDGGIMVPQNNTAAEIIELPGETNKSTTCLACCADSGRIAIGMSTTLRIFTLVDTELRDGMSSGEPSSNEQEESSRSHDMTPGTLRSHAIHLLLDIETSMPLYKLSIYNDYVAFISTYEARVLKLSLLIHPHLQNGPHPFLQTCDELLSDSNSSSVMGMDSTKDSSKIEYISQGKDCITWSPCRVWEEEKSASNSLPGSSSSSLVDISLPLTEHSKSHDSRGPSPIIGTLSVPSVCNFTSLKSKDRHPMEILGPTEYVWGLPISVKIGEENMPTTCRVLTMLYRRFPSIKGDIESRSLSNSRGEDLGLHTVQLLPIVTTDDRSGRQLIGISCFLANKSHGYLYNVHLQSHLASCFSFMSPTRAIVCDTTFLHALSAESVETYTNRSLQAAILHMPSTITSTNEWLQKPCPLPSMDLTLVSANQFVSSYCLATSQNHMVVLTKSTEHAQSKFLSSIESSWNIYILQKKNPIAMSQQFEELSVSLKDSSPSMYHHLLCEGHILLRSQILLNSQLSDHLYSQVLDSLRKNCLNLSESLCQYSTGKSAVISAAHYLVLSRHQIWKILHNILIKFPQKPSVPLSILIKFLDLVVFDAKFSDDSANIENADRVLMLYSEYKLQIIPKLILQSWLKELFSPAKALVAVNTYLQEKVLNPHQISLAKLCEAVLLTRLGEGDKAVIKLKELSDPFLSEWSGNNLNYLINKDSQLTTFGKLLLTTKENCFLEILYLSLASGQFDFEIACQLFYDTSISQHPLKQEVATTQHPPKQEIAVNLPLKHFLEGLLLEKVKDLEPKASLKALILLVDILIVRLTALATPPPSSSTPFNLYGSRHKWLDSLSPFDNLGSISKPSQVILQDLMQLQALLGHMTISSDHMITVAKHLEACLVKGMVGETSLKLLSWPHAGKINEAVQLILDTNPTITVEYCQTYFPSDLMYWKDLLDLLLTHSKSLETTHHLSSPSITPNPPFINLYKAALGHVVELCTPEEFLGLLPPSGSLLFFLPLIERSCKLHLSKQLTQHLQTNN